MKRLYIGRLQGLCRGNIEIVGEILGLYWNGKDNGSYYVSYSLPPYHAKNWRGFCAAAAHTLEARLVSARSSHDFRVLSLLLLLLSLLGLSVQGGVVAEMCSHLGSHLEVQGKYNLIVSSTYTPSMGQIMTILGYLGRPILA